MSVMDLLKSPKGIDLLDDLLECVHKSMHLFDDEETDNNLICSYEACMGEIATQQAIDQFKGIDGTPSELTHKWIP